MNKKSMPRYMYSVATGKINLLSKASRDAVEFMKKQEGFCALQMPDPWHTLFLYDSMNHAKGARNLATKEGIQCGRNICRFRYDDIGGGTITFDDPEKGG